MPEKDFLRFEKEIDQKESSLDGSCKHKGRFGLFPRHLMIKNGFLPSAGIKGKTRIVIEYDNDTGEGWIRFVTEDPNTVPILTDRMPGEKM